MSIALNKLMWLYVIFFSISSNKYVRNLEINIQGFIHMQKCFTENKKKLIIENCIIRYNNL